MIILSELQRQCFNQAQKSGFHDKPRTVGDGLFLINTELAEAYEEFRNNQPLDRVYYREDGKPEGYAVEMADAVIRILDEVQLRGITPNAFEEIVMIKLAYNLQRGHMHGGKKI